jgi:thiol-disulfide isomerase/thioredoxin
MDLKLLYFYGTSCGACKDYEATVDKLSKAFKLTLQKQNIDEKKPQYKLEGIPTLILENNGVEIWRSIGNVPFQQVYKDIKDFV